MLWVGVTRAQDEVERLCTRLETDELSGLVARMEGALIGGAAGSAEAARAAVQQQLTDLDRKDEGVRRCTALCSAAPQLHCRVFNGRAVASLA